MTLIGHAKSVYCLVNISADIISSGSEDHSIKIWNIDQPAPRIAPKIVPEIPVAAHIPSNKKITSPAYILPNSRSECESGFDTYSIKLNRKFNGKTQNLVPNGV